MSHFLPPPKQPLSATLAPDFEGRILAFEMAITAVMAHVSNRSVLLEQLETIAMGIEQFVTVGDPERNAKICAATREQLARFVQMSGGNGLQKPD